ncbi:cell wall DAN4 [Labeo rohita]|uniref:Cell wall DAN4 n=1 Tax=Labeo rohita TaxID=84645 RepID=A0A498NEF5_LABRO|nr:cell wall DAN4 [Labeo rohita]
MESGDTMTFENVSAYNLSAGLNFLLLAFVPGFAQAVKLDTRKNIAMEWRIIVPLLCLIGILHVPGNAAQTSTNGTNSTFDIVFHINLEFKDVYSNINNNETIQLKQNITTQVVPVYSGLKNFQSFDILAFRNGSIAVEGKLYFNSSDAKPIVANLTQLLHDATFTFTLNKTLTKITEVIPAAVLPNASATAPPPAKTAVALAFKINQEFNDTYSNLSHPVTQELTKNIINAVSPVYRRFPKFLGMVIKKLSRGSIAVESEIQFEATNGTSPNLTEVKNALAEAVASGNVSIPVNASTITATDVSSSNGQSILQEEISTIPQHVDSELQCGVAYKYIRGFIRMVVRKYSNGSILVDGSLQFNKTISTPTVADLAKILADNVRNGTVTLQIDPTTIKVTDASGNVGKDDDASVIGAAVVGPNADSVVPVAGNADDTPADGAIVAIVVGTDNAGASEDDSVVPDGLAIVVFTTPASVKGKDDDASVIGAAVVGANADSVVPVVETSEVYQMSVKDSIEMVDIVVLVVDGPEMVVAGKEEVGNIVAVAGKELNDFVDVVAAVIAERTGEIKNLIKEEHRRDISEM